MCVYDVDVFWRENLSPGNKTSWGVKVFETPVEGVASQAQWIQRELGNSNWCSTAGTTGSLVATSFRRSAIRLSLFPFFPVTSSICAQSDSSGPIFSSGLSSEEFLQLRWVILYTIKLGVSFKSGRPAWSWRLHICSSQFAAVETSSMYGPQFLGKNSTMWMLFYRIWICKVSTFRPAKAGSHGESVATNVFLGGLPPPVLLPKPSSQAPWSSICTSVLYSSI